MTEDKNRWIALGALVLGAGVTALAPIFVRLTETGPAAAAFWRLLFAMPILAVLAARAEGAVGRPSRFGLAAGVTFALDLAFWHYGIHYTSVGLATVLSNLTPVVVTAVAWIFLKQPPQRLFLLALAIAILGVAMMAGQREGAPGINPPLGNLISTATSVWYALYMLAIAAGRRRESTSVLMFWSSLIGLPLVLVCALVLGEQITPAGAAGWFACAGLGLVHVAGQGSIAWAMGRLPAATASLVVLVQPVLVAILGLVIFHEALTLWQIAGSAVALAGVVLAQRTSQPVKAPA